VKTAAKTIGIECHILILILNGFLSGAVRDWDLEAIKVEKSYSRFDQSNALLSKEPRHAYKRGMRVSRR
jgi:hypothetical protein